MSKKKFNPFYSIFISLALAAFVAISAGAANDADVFDTIELKTGDKVTGTVLTDIFTVSTPYSLITLEKDKISEIRIDTENKNPDVIALTAGGSLEGTIEEADFSFRLISGESVSFEKKLCKKIIIKIHKPFRPGAEI